MKLRASLLLVLWVLLAACETSPALIPTPTPFPTAVTSQVMEIACPESLAPLMMALASAYRRDVPGVQIVVLPRADTLALNALTNGDVDIAALAWWPEALPETVWLVPFARDGVAIVVHPRNGLPGVTMAQLRQLFRGRVEDWASWGGLPGPPQIISREEASGEYGYFQRKVMVDARVALTGLLAPTSDAVLESVGSDPLAVGYLSTAWLDGRVRAVTIDGIPPAQETIAAGLYPLYRDLNFATLGDPQGPARDFIQWVLGPGGQGVVVAQRFVRVVE